MARREITPNDLRLPEKSSLDITGGIATVERETIQVVDKPLEEDLADALAFNEQEIEVRLEAPQSVGDDGKPVIAYGPFSVNGRAVWLRPGEVERIKRKYLEVILRSQPFKVQTEVVKGQGEERNYLHRYVSRRFPVTIVSDPDPRGAEWARRVVMEN
jgi:hypothetical protein